MNRSEREIRLHLSLSAVSAPLTNGQPLLTMSDGSGILPQICCWIHQIQRRSDFALERKMTGVLIDLRLNVSRTVTAGHVNYDCWCSEAEGGSSLMMSAQLFPPTPEGKQVIAVPGLLTLPVLLSVLVLWSTRFIYIGSLSMSACLKLFWIVLTQIFVGDISCIHGQPFLKWLWVCLLGSEGIYFRTVTY